MSTVIDSLVVSLGMDPSAYKKGEKETGESLNRLREHGNKTGKELERSGKQAAQFFSGIRNEVIKMGAALLSVGAISSFVKTITTADFATGQLATNLGVAADRLKAWELALKDVGGSAEQVDNDFRALNNQMQQIWSGHVSPEMLTSLGILHVNTVKYLDKTTSAEERLLLLADGLQTVSRQQGIYQLAQLGYSEAMYNFLYKGRIEVEGTITATAALNKNFKKSTENAAELKAAWNHVVNQLEAVGRAVTDDINEPLVGTLRIVEKIIQALSEDTISAAHKDMSQAAEIMFNNSLFNTVGSWVASGAEYLGDLTGLGPVAAANSFNRNFSAGSRTGGVSGTIGRGGSFEDQMVAAVRRLEGSGDRAVSSKGAVGRFQVLPTTAEELGFDSSRLTDPAYGELVARAYIRKQIARYGEDPEAILAAYNGGQGAANHFLRHGRSFNPKAYEETQRYLFNYNRFAGLNSGAGGTASTTIVNLNGGITINTPATDARGIAANIGPAIRQQLLTGQANSGLSP